MCHPNRPIGFTLVELLIVIGIIALLIALLLPALNRARQASQEVVCTSNLSEIGQGLLMHVNDHRGYLPFGPINYRGGGLTPVGLNDTSRLRYEYYEDSAGTRVLPIPGAIARYLGQTIRTDSREHVEADLADGTVRNVFTCPAQGEAPQGRMTLHNDAGGDRFGPWVHSSYAINEAVFGDGGVSNVRRRGRYAGLRRPSDNAILTDGLPRLEWGPDYYPVLAASASDQTMHDGVASSTVLDYKRHRGRVAVLFADFHAEVRPMTAEGLTEVGLTLGF